MTTTSAAPGATCGNRYDKAFEITRDGRQWTFDSFECAIAALAPKCDHCGCTIIGHGLEKDRVMSCCAHCAGQAGVTELRDRARATAGRHGHRLVEGA